MDIRDSVYVVAVDVRPVVWAVQCDLCDDIVSIHTSDNDLIDRLEEEHIQQHS